MLCRFILRMANPTVRVAKKLFAVDWNSKIPARFLLFGFIIFRLPRVPIFTLFFNLRHFYEGKYILFSHLTYNIALKSLKLN